MVDSKAARQSTKIEVTPVYRYSYGQSTDGSVVLWAEGRAGWFEISPANNYHDIFLSMEEAVHIYYFMVDVYSHGQMRWTELFVEVSALAVIYSLSLEALAVELL